MLVALAAVSLGLLVYNYLAMWNMGSTVCLLIVVLIIAGVTLAEGRGDEREVYHRLLASRTGFVIGLVLLSAGLIDEVLEHRLDPWLVYALAGMVLGKTIGLAWGRVKH